MRKDNRSRDQLIKSVDRRVKHLMIRTLEKFEDMFPSIDETRKGGIYKSDLRNIFNDVVRAQRDELYDYEIDYRPFKKTDDNTLIVTKEFMETIQNIEFDFQGIKPVLKFYAAPEKMRVLEAVRREFECGALYEEDDKLILYIAGIDSVINNVLPLMDKYYLHEKVRNQYRAWRIEVIKTYRS